MDSEDYERAIDLFDSSRIEGTDASLSNLTNDDLYNPIEEVWKKKIRSRVNNKNKKSPKSQSESKQPQQQPEGGTERFPRVVDINYYSVDDFNPNTIYESSCDEIDTDENENENENDIELSRIDLTYSPSVSPVREERYDCDENKSIDFGSDSSSSSDNDDDDNNDELRGELLIDNTGKNKKKVVSKRHPIINKPATKKSKVEVGFGAAIDHDFCFLCDKRSRNNIERDKVTKIVDMIYENLIHQDDEKIARCVHEYYKNEIYEKLKERGEEDVKMWTSRSIMKHISEILDPRYQLLKKEIRTINKEIEETSKYCYVIKTYDNGTRKKDINEKAHREKRAWIKLKMDLCKIDYDKLPLSNKNSKIDLEAAGTCGPKFNFKSTSSSQKKLDNFWDKK